MVRLVHTLLFLLTLILPISCGSSSDSPSESAPPVEQQILLGDSAVGLELYEVNCSSCHGPVEAGEVGNKDKSELLAIVDRPYHRKVFAKLTVQDRDAIFELLAGRLPAPR